MTGRELVLYVPPSEAGDHSNRKQAWDEHRLLHVMHAYLKGETQTEIAEKNGWSQTTVSRHICEVRRRWQRSNERAIGEKMAQVIAGIELIERRAWKDYDRSIEVSGDRIGDPRFLELALKCKDRITKILGGDAPKKIDITAATPQPPRPVAEIEGEIARVREQIRRAKAAGQGEEAE